MSQFVSYAQNFEDVMLWRALRHIQNGFYVDVGANDPKFDSVTQAFYERGWRGINIEPMPSYYEALCRERPEDINLRLAVAESERTITFFEVPETGLSTVVAEVIQNVKSAGWVVTESAIQAKPLNIILEDHACKPIHFLKIDVEGFEHEALKGLDLSRWRPWIILVEATAPSSQSPSYEIWEPLLLSSAYAFAYFDGVNRFYVAEEHKELIESFSAPPNIFDGFVSYQHIMNANEYFARQESVIQALSEKVKDLEAAKKELNALRSELDWARTDLAYLRNEIERTRNERDKLRLQYERDTEELNSARVEITNLKRERDALSIQNEKIMDELRSRSKEAEDLRNVLEQVRNEAEDLRVQYVNILYSKSYRITAPLRAFYLLLQRMRKADQMETQSQVVNIQHDKVEELVVLNTDILYFRDLFQHEIDKRSER